MSEFVVSALYKFVALEDYQRLREPLLAFMQAHDIKGTLLLAREGINGTVAGLPQAIEQLLAHLKADPRLADLEHKESHHAAMPFYRSKVKLKREIVTMGVPGIDPREVVGTYVKPQDWNALISDPEVTVIDTRNRYEVTIGTFANAIDPGTDAFREFPAYVEQHLDPAVHRKVAMFCTGGIRCEKSTAYLKSRGFEEVYHLQGGILKYLETVPQEQSLWQGECFVFDNRVTVDHQLQRGHYQQCHACRMPITEEQMRGEHYRPGLSCPHCHDAISDEQRSRFAERQHQVKLARQRREAHLGADAVAAREQRKARKLAAKNRQRQEATAAACR